MFLGDIMRSETSISLLFCLLMISSVMVPLGTVAEDGRADSRDLNGWDESSTGLPGNGPWSSVALESDRRAPWLQ